MRNRVDIEDIEDMRRIQGIDDVELREEISGLASGDFVKLTLSAGEAAAGETVLVRITNRKGDAFRGKLVGRPTSAGLAELPVGYLLVFTAAHIHSVAKKQTARRHS